MIIKIDEHSTTAPSEQLADQIKRGIYSEKLTIGEKLPTVRQLAYDLDVAPNTVAKAYYLLQDEGLLELKGRKGTFVSEGWKQAVQKDSQKLQWLLSEISIVAHQQNLNVVELCEQLKKTFNSLNES
jgi:DNA-binding transcriptional regulator YhcF (GntR family)